jgi:hypothetical protein
VQDFANPRTRGQRREKDLDFFCGGGNRRSQIERKERGERRGLRGVRACRQFGGEAVLQQRPARGFTLGGDRHRAQPGPELHERAQGRRLGDLAADDLPHFDRGQFAFAVERLKRAEHNRRSPSAGGRLPLAISANRRHPGKHFRGNEEIRLLGKSAQQVEGDDAAFTNEAREEFSGFRDCGWRGCDALRTQTGFHERWRRRRELRVTREEQAKSDVVEPLRGGVEGAQRGGRIRPDGLVPQRGARDL